MPLYRNRSVVEIARGIKAFLNVEAGVTRGKIPEQDRNGNLQQELQKARRQLAAKDQKITKAEERLALLDHFQDLENFRNRAFMFEKRA